MHVIEFLGMPRSGKTGQIRLLQKRLEASGLHVGVVEDREIEKHVHCPLEQGLAYNLLFFHLVFQRLVELSSACDIVILDRGFTDAKAWFDVERAEGRISAAEHRAACASMRFLERKYVHFKIFLSVTPQTTMVRNKQAKEKSLTDGFCMNKRFLTALHAAYLSLGRRIAKEKNGLSLEGTATPQATHERIVSALRKSGITTIL